MCMCISMWNWLIRHFKEEEVPQEEEIEQDWREVLAECVVRLDTLESQVAKLYKRQQPKHKLTDKPEITEDNVLKETEKYIILKDGKIIQKLN